MKQKITYRVIIVTNKINNTSGVVSLCVSNDFDTTTLDDFKVETSHKIDSYYLCLKGILKFIELLASTEGEDFYIFYVDDKDVANDFAINNRNREKNLWSILDAYQINYSIKTSSTVMTYASSLGKDHG